MKKLTFALFLLTIAQTALAQFTVAGHIAVFDSLTGNWLATLPEAQFGKDCRLQLKLDEGWKHLVIGGDTIADAYTFINVSADSLYTTTVIDTLGQTTTGSLQFTFLPIVRLSGQFGYDDRIGSVTIADPAATEDTLLQATIRWRGGSTNGPNKHKRNYKLKFDNDVRLFGMRNDNNWILDAGQPDVFRLRNRIAMDIWNSMATPPYYADKEPKARNGVSGIIAEVFLNNEYRGFYNLSENMDRKQMKVKKVDKNTGEIRGCLYKGVSWNNTRMFAPIDSYDNSKETLVGYEVKYPDLQDSDTTDWAPLVTANNFANFSTDQEFQEQVDSYFDMPVVMDYNIFYNVVNAVDNAGKNTYWAVYDKTKSARLTPAPWDLDATFGQRWGGLLEKVDDEGLCTSPDYRLDLELMVTYRHFRDNFNDYIGKMNTRYHQLRQPGQPLHTDSLVAVLDHYYKMVKNSGAAAREQKKWSGDSDIWGDSIDFDSEYASIREWIRQRMDFIDVTELPLFYKQSYFDELNVNSPLAIGRPTDKAIHDLSGRLVTTRTTTGLKPGLYIRDGRKIIIRRYTYSH